MSVAKAILQDLFIAQNRAYEPNGFVCSPIIQETESKEYSACGFTLNNILIKFRIAKITPTKIGQFVTFWKRLGNGPIMPYDLTDHFDFLIVSVRKAYSLGQFVFPKDVLCQKGFISKEGMGGKRAMRVYPPWDITDSDQAKKTQAWQLLYFFEIEPAVDNERMKQLLD